MNANTLRYVLEMIKGGKEVQLHLRRLEDMTEEEAIELFRLCSLIDLSACNFEFFREDIGWCINALSETRVVDAISFDNNIVSMMYNDGSLHPMNPQILAIHWLISRGFDLFNLIENGLAIDAKTINTI